MSQLLWLTITTSLTDCRNFSDSSPESLSESDHLTVYIPSRQLSSFADTPVVRNWILMSCQLHRVTSGQSNWYSHKEMHTENLFSSESTKPVLTQRENNTYCHVCIHKHQSHTCEESVCSVQYEPLLVLKSTGCTVCAPTLTSLTPTYPHLPDSHLPSPPSRSTRAK